MPEVTKERLALLERLLATGPLVIGEDHTQPHARYAIAKLIERGAVKFLSLESPIGPERITRTDGQIVDVDSYFAGVTSMSNPMPMADLVRYAIDKQIAVYFHDIPTEKNPLNFIATQGKDMTAYPNYARAFLPTSIPNLPSREGAAAKLYVQRNEYTANYLQAKLGRGVRVLFGLVILAGASHVRRSDCQGQYERTLQGRLGISPSRAFICE